MSGESLINKNFYNSRTSHGFDMKLGQVTKRDKTNTETSKNFDADIMLANCDIIVI